MSDFAWHDMEAEQPPEGKGDYLLLGKRGALYVAASFKHRSFYVPNKRGAFIESGSVRAWATIPKYEEKAVGV